MTGLLGPILLPFTILIFLAIGILGIIAVVILLELFRRGSTKRCPHCGNRIPTDAVWCKFCRADLTSESTPFVREAGGEDKTCPDCGGSMDYVEKNDRWYCTYCSKYGR